MNEFSITKRDEVGGTSKFIIFLIIVFLVMSAYIIYDKFIKEDKVLKDDYNENKEVNNEENNKSEEIILTSHQLSKYLEYVPLLTEDFEYSDAYKGELVTINTISKEVYLDYVFSKSLDVKEAVDKYSECSEDEEECAGSKNVLISEFNNKLKEYYNIESSELDTFGCGIKKGEKHYGSFCNRDSYPWKKVGKFLKYEVVNDELIIYEQAVFYSYDFDNYYIYKNSNVDNRLANVYEQKTIDFADIEGYLSSNLESFNVFKHTFKKNDNDYYWYSTEIVNINSITAID